MSRPETGRHAPGLRRRSEAGAWSVRWTSEVGSLARDEEISANDASLFRGPGELLRLEPFLRLREVLRMDLYEGGVQIIDVSVDGSVHHPVAGACLTLGSVVHQPRLKILDLSHARRRRRADRLRRLRL